ncbi:hypothetical protein C8Q73DRAFT_669357 [Cubamyces lactineus]|nr:hypothetical protein C8Q73DRAFT_669357 [Cubamyces lactineus]
MFLFGPFWDQCDRSPTMIPAARVSRIMEPIQASMAFHASRVDLQRHPFIDMFRFVKRLVVKLDVASDLNCVLLYGGRHLNVSTQTSLKLKVMGLDDVKAEDMRKFYDESFTIGYLEDSTYSTRLQGNMRLRVEDVENPDRLPAVLCIALHHMENQLLAQGVYFARSLEGFGAHAARLCVDTSPDASTPSTLEHREAIAAAAKRRTLPALEATLEQMRLSQAHIEQARDAKFRATKPRRLPRWCPDWEVLRTAGRAVSKRFKVWTQWTHPEFETEQDYLAFYCSKEAAIFRQASSCPCLLLSITHKRIIVNGALFGYRIISHTLDETITLSQTLLNLFHNDNEGIYLVASFICALRAVLDELAGYYARISAAYQTKAIVTALHDPSNYIEPHFDTFEMGDRRMKPRYTGRVQKEPKTAALTAIAQVPDADTEQDVVVLFMPSTVPDMSRLLTNKWVGPDAPRLWFCEWVQSTMTFVVVMGRIAVVKEGAKDAAGPILIFSDFIRLHETAEKQKTSSIVLGKRANAYVLTRGQDGEPLLMGFDCSDNARNDWYS